MILIQNAILVAGLKIGILLIFSIPFWQEKVILSMELWYLQLKHTEPIELKPYLLMPLNI